MTLSTDAAHCPCWQHRCCRRARRQPNDLPLAELPGQVEAPEFALPDLAGKVQRLSAFRGRPVLVNFWAVWCPPCRRELAELAELRKSLADTPFEILAVNLGDSVERIKTFLANYPAPNLPILLDADKTSAAAPWHVRPRRCRSPMPWIAPAFCGSAQSANETGARPISSGNCAR